MFPLKERILIRGAQGHLNAGLGIGADYRAKYVPFVIPFDGVVSTYWGKQGGNWLRLTRPNGDKIELAHLQSYAIKSGQAKAGQPGGVTGNTGEVTDFPHLHIQIIDKNGKRLDPEKYNWEEAPQPMPIQYPLNIRAKLIANNFNWPSTLQKLTEVDALYKEASGNKLTVPFDVAQTNFRNIPFVTYSTYPEIDRAWYKQNITPLALGYNAVIFAVLPEDWKSTTGGFGAYGKPYEISIRADDFTLPWGVNSFVNVIAHELRHLIGATQVVDTTHDYFTASGSDLKGSLANINYDNLNNYLKEGVLVPQIITQAKGPERRIVLKAADQTEWLSLCKVFGKDPNKPEETV